MYQGFWGKLKKPFFVLAPMADVTDPAFRRIITTYGKPDVTWTEFVSADGLFLADKEGQEKIKRDLEYSEAERPIVAQFFTSDPEMMKKAAKYAVECGFDGFDINMGCPDKSIEKQKAGAALMKNPQLAQELIRAAKDGVMESGKDIPVSVKTRIGYNKNELEEWLPILLEAEPVALTLHARTRKQMSKVPADWSHIKRAVEIRDQLKSETFILGNGDALDLEDAQKKVDETGCDGVMLGRAIFGNPWLFDNNKKEVSITERLTVLVEHTKLYEKLLGDVKSFNVMKKHYKAYVSGWDGAKELRIKLMNARDAGEVEGIVHSYLENSSVV
ncbi:tRNA-dihydrouridine synthase [Candidatus Kaiserbacteria bacterium]|nr:tRNA-dihydrouridine synthase [Candidatus Kaiserbacteria bacterium]